MRDPFLEPPPSARKPTPTELSVDELLEMRAQIDAKLPVKDLKDMDMARELVLQVQALQALQRRVLREEETPANQVAAVANALSSALSNLVKMQNDLYTSERMKRVELILIECLDTLPEKVQRKFFEMYEKELG